VTEITNRPQQPPNITEGLIRHKLADLTGLISRRSLHASELQHILKTLLPERLTVKACEAATKVVFEIVGKVSPLNGNVLQLRHIAVQGLVTKV